MRLHGQYCRHAAADGLPGSACQYCAVRVPLRPQPAARDAASPGCRSIECTDVARDRAHAAEAGEDLEHLGGLGDWCVADIHKIIRQDREALADEEPGRI